MLIDFTETSHDRGDPDINSFLILINELFESRPELFGAPKQQKAFAADCDAKMAQYKAADQYAAIQNFLRALPALFKQHSINPLANVDVIFVAPYQRYFDIIQELTAQFNTFHIIPAGQSLYTSNAHKLADRLKADFVITGNVLNEPENKNPRDTMQACAMMLKQGGKAIHVLSHSGVPDRGEQSDITSPKHHQTIGQQHLRNIPMTLGIWNFGPYATILQQEQAIPYNIPPAEPEVVTTEPEHGGKVDPRVRKKE